MGACFQVQTYDGKLTEKEVREKFERLQDQDRYENGHSYSGGFGMASGLKFEHQGRPVFESWPEAEEYLSNRCKKWEEARVVRYREGPGTEERWFIAAWCAE